MQENIGRSWTHNVFAKNWLKAVPLGWGRKGHRIFFGGLPPFPGIRFCLYYLALVSDRSFVISPFCCDVFGLEGVPCPSVHARCPSVMQWFLSMNLRNFHFHSLNGSTLQAIEMMQEDHDTSRCAVGRRCARFPMEGLWNFATLPVSVYIVLVGFWIRSRWCNSVQDRQYLATRKFPIIRLVSNQRFPFKIRKIQTGMICTWNFMKLWRV